MLETAKTAREVWSVGWSMTETDSDLIKYLESAIQQRTEKLDWLRIINVPAAKQAGLDHRRASFLKPLKIEAHWEGLENWRGWNQR